MKKIKLVMCALLMFCSMSIMAQQNEGIAFLPTGTPFADVVKAAQQSHKKILVDCFTTWCGPCKMMARDVFPQKKVGDAINSGFVSVQIDMEKGEGRELQKKWEVGAFPTFIIFNSNGQEIGRFLGGSDADGFIDRVNKASVDNSSASMDERFEAGERSTEFLLAYLKTLSGAYKRDKCNEVAELLLADKAETFASDTLLADIFMKHLQNPFAPAFIYTVKHPEALSAAVGERNVFMKTRFVWQTFPRTLIIEHDSTATIDQEKFDKWLALMEECGVDKAFREDLRLNSLLTYHEKSKQWSEYVKDLKDYEALADITDLALCKLATPVARNCSDAKVKGVVKKMLQQRVKDLESGKREPQKQQGNMRLSGNLVKAMNMLIDVIDGKQVRP